MQTIKTSYFKIFISSVIALVFCLYSNIFAQNSEIIFKHLNKIDGLSNSNVSCMFQDSRGYLWFGTHEGLNRYDGYEFTVYKHCSATPSSIRADWIHGIQETDNGDIWVLTTEGVSVYDYRTNTFETKKIEHTKGRRMYLNTFMRATDDTFWFGTISGFVYHYNQKNNSIERYNSERGFTAIGIRCIYEDSKHNIWVGTQQGGVFLLKEGSDKFVQKYYKDENSASLVDITTPYFVSNQISSNSINYIFEDSDKNLWIGTLYSGLNRVNVKNNEITIFNSIKNNEKTLNGKSASYIFEDSQKRLWVSADGLNLFNKATQNFTRYKANFSNPASITSASISQIYEDSQHNLWISSKQGGLDYFKTNENNSFEYIRQIPGESNSLSKNSVASILEDSKNNLWIGTDGGGLNYYDAKKQTFIHYIHKRDDQTTIPSNAVNSIYKDNQNNIWLGCSDGLSRFDTLNKTFTTYKHNELDSNSIPHNDIRDIFQKQDDNTFIIASNGGNIFTINSDFKISLYYRNVGYFLTIFQDSYKNIWYGSYGGLLYESAENDIVKMYQVDDTSRTKISNNFVYSIIEDDEKYIWVGTSGGLNRLDPKTQEFMNFTTANGLPSNVINALVKGDENIIWLSTSNGISKLNTKKLTFKNWGFNDGLPITEFMHGSCAKLKNGKIYFGGVNGLIGFHPDSLSRPKINWPVVITSFKIFNQEILPDETGSPLSKHIGQTKEITLSYSDYSFSFDFLAFNYFNADHNIYSYIMEGFDKEWIYSGNRRFASYTNLNPGKYIFKVKCLNNTHQTEQNIAKIKIIITPPFWKTIWFYILVATAIVFGVYWFIRARENKLKRQNQILEAKVKKRTAQILQHKEEIEAQRDEIEKHRDNIVIQNKNITDSIVYAKRIQNAILPTDELFRKVLPQSFVFFKPRDIVSGDFYWAAQKNEKFIIAAVDCTGHGVPGAFMSMLGIAFLNGIMQQNKELSAADILGQLRNKVKTSLKQTGKNNEAKDSMDIALCVIDTQKHKLEYSGAHNPLIIIRDKNFPAYENANLVKTMEMNDRQLIQVKASCQPIGIYLCEKPFTNHDIQLYKNDTIYLFSDGFIDQIGGDKNRKYMIRKFKKLLLEIQGNDMCLQNNIIEKELYDWQGNNEQVDDILVIGFEF